MRTQTNTSVRTFLKQLDYSVRHTAFLSLSELHRWQEDYVASSSDEDEPQEALASKLESKRKELIHIEQVCMLTRVCFDNIDHDQIRMELEKLDAESDDDDGVYRAFLPSSLTKRRVLGRSHPKGRYELGHGSCIC